MVRFARACTQKAYVTLEKVVSLEQDEDRWRVAIGEFNKSTTSITSATKEMIFEIFGRKAASQEDKLQESKEANSQLK